MTWRRFALVLLVAVCAAPRGVVGATETDYHHVHLTALNAEVAVQWYLRHMGCEPIPSRPDACELGTVRVVFSSGLPMGGSQRTGVDSIAVSFADLAAKMKEFQAVGIGGAGVRILTPMHDEPGLYMRALVIDPWGTRIEVVEDPEHLGFHHINLRSANPGAALKWYQSAFGGQAASLKGRLNGLLYGKVWLFVTQAEGQPASTAGRAIDHLAFSFPDLDAAAAELAQKGIQFQQAPQAISNGPVVKNAFVVSPDDVRIELVQP